MEIERERERVMQSKEFPPSHKQQHFSYNQKLLDETRNKPMRLELEHNFTIEFNTFIIKSMSFC